jgi:hypothetical protein
MHATEVLQSCLRDALGSIHALRARAVIKATDALIRGRRLTLMDLARSWPDAERVRAPLKALDRLLSNAHIHDEREPIYKNMARWLVRDKQPVIIIDWADLKADRSWHLLRAAIAVGGRSLTVLDMVFPDGQQGTPGAERQFLLRLAHVLPSDVHPILVTDAGFRAPWFRAVEAMGWHWLGRLRHRTHVKPFNEPNEESQWVPCKDMYLLATTRPTDFGHMHAVRNAPLACHLVLYAQKAKGRKHFNRQGDAIRSKYSRQHARRESEPWLLMASPELPLTARQMVRIYARRMQIELSFRDLKSHRYGQGFEDSLTRKGKRIEVLLLLSAMAAFASWIVGVTCEATGMDVWLAPRRSTRRLYSVMRLGREALVRRWPLPGLRDLMRYLRYPSCDVLEQLVLPV